MTFNINKAVSKTFNESEDSKDGITNPEAASSDYNDENQPEANVLITNEAGVGAAECPADVMDKDGESATIYAPDEFDNEINTAVESILSTTLTDREGESITIYALDEYEELNLEALENICSPSLIDREEYIPLNFKDLALEPNPEVAINVEAGEGSSKDFVAEDRTIMSHNYDVCHSILSSTEGSVSHGKKHTEGYTGRQTREKPFKCNECGKIFQQNCRLQRHQKIHSGERPFTCNKCKKAFAREDSLKKHMHDVHYKEPCLSCPLCNIQFRSSHNIIKHLKFHSRELNFLCPVCYTAFSRMSYLKRHLKTHSEERPFTCHKCKKAFAREERLKKHMHVVHYVKPCLSCPLCNIQFQSSYRIKKHLKFHSKELNFLCPVCFTAFSRIQHLKRHLKTHSEDKI